jgi:hypothetical protein
MANKRDLKAFVRYDGTGRVIAGSNILQRKKPKVGNWEEIAADECCTTSSTTTVAPTTTTTTTSSSTSTTTSTTTAGYDPDALAFFAAASITETTEKDAVNQLVLDMKADGIWTKMRAVYPYVGGDASKHSYNLINPATFQITWSGGVTHNASGITGNGTNGYGNTNFNPSTQFISNTNYSFGIYSSSTDTGEGADFGTYENTNADFLISAHSAGSVALFDVQRESTRTTIAAANAQGFRAASRNGNTTAKIYKDATSADYSIDSVAAFTLPNLNITVLTWNGVPVYSPRTLNFTFMGDYLTPTEAEDFRQAIVTLNTTLSR